MRDRCLVGENGAAEGVPLTAASLVAGSRWAYYYIIYCFFPVQRQGNAMERKVGWS